MTGTQDSWPAGATWVFQGTIAEDATAGTHVCTLTVTPGAGNELQILLGNIVVGNTATAQTVTVKVTDGTNDLGEYLLNISITSANAILNFPGLNAGNNVLVPGFPLTISGSMTLILRVSTAAVSVTQSFAVVCRIKGAKPTATLLDTIGTSTNTVNTDKVF